MSRSGGPARAGLALLSGALLAATAGCGSDGSGVLGGDGGETTATAVQEQTDEAMTAILDATLVPLDLRSTTGSRNYIGCELSMQYDADVQLAGAYADQPTLAGQTDAIGAAATDAGFDVQPGRNPHTLTGTGTATVPGSGDTVELDLYLAAPPARSEVDHPVAGGGLRTLTIESGCFDADDDLRREFGVQDYADAVPADRIF